jgi:hypothetical protein
MKGRALPTAREDHASKYSGDRTDGRDPPHSRYSLAEEDAGSVRIGPHHPPGIDTCLPDALGILLIELDFLICISSHRKLRPEHACVNARILFRAAQIRQSIETAGEIVDALRPPCLRRARVHSRLLCPGAPASVLCSLVAARLPPCTGFGMPLALERDEVFDFEQLRSAVETAIDVLIQSQPLAKSFNQFSQVTENLTSPDLCTATQALCDEIKTRQADLNATPTVYVSQAAWNVVLQRMQRLRTDVANFRSAKGW